MPIRRIVVHWGDEPVNGSPRAKTVLEPFLGKNRKKECRKDENGEPVSFGDSPDACEEGFYKFSDHRYFCPSSWKEEGSGKECSRDSDGNIIIPPDGCYDKDHINSDGTTGACIYKPRVQVKDNWGWCTGTCRGTPPNQGCYDASGQIGREDECEVENEDYDHWHWVTFAGQVIVTP